VNTVNVVAIVSEMVIQYHVAFDEKMYSLGMDGIRVSFSRKCIFPSFSSRIMIFVISCSVSGYFCCMSFIS